MGAIGTMGAIGGHGRHWCQWRQVCFCNWKPTAPMAPNQWRQWRRMAPEMSYGAGAIGSHCPMAPGAIQPLLRPTAQRVRRHPPDLYTTLATYGLDFRVGFYVKQKDFLQAMFHQYLTNVITGHFFLLDLTPKSRHNVDNQ